MIHNRVLCIFWSKHGIMELEETTGLFGNTISSHFGHSHLERSK